MLHTIRVLVACALTAALALPSAAAQARPRPAAAAAAAAPLPLATPESQGMSRTRLERMHVEVRRLVDEGKHAGIATLVARNGRVVDLYSYGKASLEPDQPMQQDTIFRIYSMSKIVSSVAALILLEEARFKLDDPIGNYLPELANMKVFTGGTKEKPLLADAQKPITIESLLTHSSGLIYGFGSGPIDQIYRDARIEESASLADFVTRVSKLPLAHEPGERFAYSNPGYALLRRIVERETGESLREAIALRIAGPLDLRDTEVAEDLADLAGLVPAETTFGAPAAVLNAISDALKPFGVGVFEMPATPQRIRALIRAAQAGEVP